MREKINNRSKQIKSMWIIAFVNSGIWIISLIALVFIIQHSPGAKGLLPILIGGAGVSTALLSVLFKLR